MTDDMMPALPDSTKLVEFTHESGVGTAIYETTTGDIEVETIHDDGSRDVFITMDGAGDEKDVVLDLVNRIKELETAHAIVSEHDRAALSTAAFELKGRRNNYAAMLQRFERGGADPFVIEAYRDSVKACDEAVAVCERLAKGGG
jgi:hypothetical protein